MSPLPPQTSKPRWVQAEEGKNFSIEEEPRVLMLEWPGLYYHYYPKKSSQKSSGNFLGFHPEAEKNM